MSEQEIEKAYSYPPDVRVFRLNRGERAALIWNDGGLCHEKWIAENDDRDPEIKRLLEELETWKNKYIADTESQANNLFIIIQEKESLRRELEGAREALRSAETALIVREPERTDAVLDRIRKCLTAMEQKTLTKKLGPTPNCEKCGRSLAVDWPSCDCVAPDKSTE